MEGATLVVAALAAGASAATTNVVSAAVMDAYQALKTSVLRLLSGSSRNFDDASLDTTMGDKTGRDGLASDLLAVGVDEPTIEAARRLLGLLDKQEGKFVVDASQAKGIIVGDNGVQHNTFNLGRTKLAEETPPRTRFVDASRARGLIIGDNATLNATYNTVITGSGSELEVIADQLAVAVRRQWAYEATWRQLNDPYAMSVHWKGASPDLAVDWQSLVKLATTGPGGPWSPLESWAQRSTDLAGTANELVDVLDRVPTGRIAVLGQPGAGKTILLVRLVLDLLADRLAGQPVPVLFPLASWNVDVDDLYTWMEVQLATDQPALSRRVADGSVSKARGLLEAGLILPVLDGLDEMPSRMIGAAIVDINASMRPGQRLVLASRIDPYRDAVSPVTGARVRLAGAAAIELLPLDIEDVITYLRDSAGSASAGGWSPVFASLSGDGSTPVATALKTPLMASLARAVYDRGDDERTRTEGTDPTELLDLQRFPTHQDIERHLLDRLIPAVYRRHPDRSRRVRWNAAQAARWFSFLARHLDQRLGGTTDLAWWELNAAIPRWCIGIVVGGVAGIFGMVGYGVPIGLGTGLAATAITAICMRKLLRAPKTRLWSGLVGGLVGGMTGALVGLAVFGVGIGSGRLGAFVMGGLAYGLSVAPIGDFKVGAVSAFVGGVLARVVETHAGSYSTGILAHIMSGIGLGLVVGSISVVAGRRSPARRLTWSRVGFACGLGVGLVNGFAAWATVGWKGGIAVGFVATIISGYAGGVFFEAIPTDIDRAPTPLVVLKRDRTTFWASWLALGFAMGLGTGIATGFGPTGNNGHSNGLFVGLGIGVANLVAVGLAFAFIQAAWGSFVLTRVWLAVTGRLPWRLVAFLIDAHTVRGVLRQVGGVYQFRHLELQHRLTETSGSPQVDSPDQTDATKR